MPNIGISEEKQIVEVVEGVGHIPYNRVPFCAAPESHSRSIWERMCVYFIWTNRRVR